MSPGQTSWKDGKAPHPLLGRVEQSPEHGHSRGDGGPSGESEDFMERRCQISGGG